MLRIIGTIFLLLSVLTSAAGQYASGIYTPERSELLTDFSDPAFRFASTISTSDLKDHVYKLSSDQFEGRETGTEGVELASDYLAENFAQLGLPQIGSDSTHFQPVAFTFSSWKKVGLRMDDQQLKYLRDFVAFPQHSISDIVNNDHLVFLGYGIDEEIYSDYKGADVKDKVVMVFDGEPADADRIFTITGTKESSLWSENHRLKSAAAKKHGARLLIIISNDLKKLVSTHRSQLLHRVTELGNTVRTEKDEVNTIFISSSAAEKILGDYRDKIIQMRDEMRTGDPSIKIRSKVPSNIEAQLNVQQLVISGQNVLGFIEGSDKMNEVIILSAHYDHIGKKGNEIYNGADDNASGTSAVLEIAEALATAKHLGLGPDRSILCLLVTGEEKGLLGSDYFARNPSFPLSNIVANINIDMIGRWGKDYEQRRQNPYVYVIGSDRLSTDLHRINEEINRKYSGLIMDYKYNDEKDPNRFYYRSDHYNFAKRGIPSIFFFNGVHSDYHRISDTPDKIDFALLQKRTKQIFHLVWELANRKERIQLTKDSSTSP